MVTAEEEFLADRLAGAGAASNLTGWPRGSEDGCG
jgi:hypothetical protein